jgi:hypothetical protein
MHDGLMSAACVLPAFARNKPVPGGAMNSCCARTALAENGTLTGRVFIHMGDESGFDATPFTTGEKPNARHASGPG